MDINKYLEVENDEPPSENNKIIYRARMDNDNSSMCECSPRYKSSFNLGFTRVSRGTPFIFYSRNLNGCDSGSMD
jgi:hypothetical protein